MATGASPVWAVMADSSGGPQGPPPRSPPSPASVRNLDFSSLAAPKAIGLFRTHPHAAAHERRSVRGIYADETDGMGWTRRTQSVRPTLAAAPTTPEGTYFASALIFSINWSLSDGAGLPGCVCTGGATSFS